MYVNNMVNCHVQDEHWKMRKIMSLHVMQKLIWLLCVSWLWLSFLQLATVYNQHCTCTVTQLLNILYFANVKCAKWIKNFFRIQQLLLPLVCICLSPVFHWKKIREDFHNGPTEKCSLIDINSWINVAWNDISSC